jgi:hypothetical protein
MILPLVAGCSDGTRVSGGGRKLHRPPGPPPPVQVFAGTKLSPIVTRGSEQHESGRHLPRQLLVAGAVLTVFGTIASGDTSLRALAPADSTSLKEITVQLNAGASTLAAGGLGSIRCTALVPLSQ